MTGTAAPERLLARRLLDQALDDLRREAARAGREPLFDLLLPRLVADTTHSPQTPASAPAYSESELRLALARLRARLRERVNEHLRALEPDAARRRDLRQRLRALTIEPEPEA